MPPERILVEQIKEDILLQRIVVCYILLKILQLIITWNTYLAIILWSTLMERISLTKQIALTYTSYNLFALLLDTRSVSLQAFDIWQCGRVSDSTPAVTVTLEEFANYFWPYSLYWRVSGKFWINCLMYISYIPFLVTNL